MDKSGYRLRQARQAAGFRSARAAALRFGWPPSTYASHENGQTQVPEKAAFAYAKAFRVSPYWILYNLGPQKGGIDEMLTGQPEDVWELARATVAAIIAHRR